VNIIDYIINIIYFITFGLIILKKKIIIEFICTLISKCLARAHCLKLATKHHRHRLIRSGLKTQMLFFVLSDIFFLLGQTRKKIMGQTKKRFLADLSYPKP
jgi:hypothetical protein